MDEDMIICAIDIAERDNAPSVKDWIRITATQMKMKGFTPVLFNGKTEGRTVFAFISNGRWLAVCESCGNCEYVDPINKILFCMKCSNEKSGSARPVKFPKDWKEIEIALLHVEMVVPGNNPIRLPGRVSGGIAEQVVNAFNARPKTPDLRRDWAPKELSENPVVQQSIRVSKFGESANELKMRIRNVKEASRA